MSLSNPVTRTSSPVDRFLRFNAKDGLFAHYDKESGKMVENPMPFDFIVLDIRSKIAGWDEGDKSAIYSNEVVNLKEEELTVRNGSGVIFQGHYADIKEKVQAFKGMNFTTVIYAMGYDEQLNPELFQIALNRSNLGAWMEFKDSAKLKNPVGKKISVTSTQEKKNGAVKYIVPVFEVSDNPLEAEMEIAMALDRKLQTYFNPSEETVDLEVVEDDLPF